MIAFLGSAVARGQEVGEPAAEDDLTIDVGGYVETYVSHNFNTPENGVSNLRGFDGRADAITVSNVVVDVAGEKGEVSSRVVLQVGHTPNTYFLAEPTLGATGGVGESDARTWRLIQQAWTAWQASERTSFEAGVFLSPVGPESIVAKDDWNFSRSNLFYGLPFYHAGARMNVQVSEPLKLTGAVFNGWNTVADNNRDKSVMAQAVFARAPVTATALYFGGVERPEGGAQSWRHLVDTYVQIDATDRLSFLVHGDVGFEGQGSWQAAAAYARVRPIDELYVALRGDLFREVADPDTGAIFWPVQVGGVGRVASATLTLDWRPIDDGLSLRLEGRHDDANAPMFFAGADDDLDARTQQTVTVAAIGWF